MGITLLLFIIIVAISAFRGYRSGIFVIAARMISLAVAYLAAILFSADAAKLIQEYTSIEGMISYVIAGTIVFLVTSIILSLIFSTLIRHFTAKSKENNKTASSVAGGLFGAVVGCFIGLMVVWFVSTIQEILLVKKGQQIVQPSVLEQTAKKLTGAAIGGIVSTATGDSDLAAGAKQLLSNPAQNIQYFNRLTQSGTLRNFFQDSQVRTALDSQNPAALLNSQVYKNLTGNPDFVGLTKQLKLSGTSENKDKQLAIKVTNMWAQIKQVQNNPQYREIMQDPEIKHMLRSGNAYKLLSSAKIERLIQIISSSEVPKFDNQDAGYQESSYQEARYPEKASQQKGEQSNLLVEKKSIYRWVDEDGKVHYSDKKKQ